MGEAAVDAVVAGLQAAGMLVVWSWARSRWRFLVVGVTTAAAFMGWALVVDPAHRPLLELRGPTNAAVGIGAAVLTVAVLAVPRYWRGTPARVGAAALVAAAAALTKLATDFLIG